MRYAPFSEWQPWLFGFQLVPYDCCFGCFGYFACLTWEMHQDVVNPGLLRIKELHYISKYYGVWSRWKGDERGKRGRRLGRVRTLHLTFRRTGAPAVPASATNVEHRHMDIRIAAGCEFVQKGCITISLKRGSFNVILLFIARPLNRLPLSGLWSHRQYNLNSIKGSLNRSYKRSIW